MVNWCVRAFYVGLLLLDGLLGVAGWVAGMIGITNVMTGIIPENYLRKLYNAIPAIPNFGLCHCEKKRTTTGMMSLCPQINRWLMTEFVIGFT